MNVYSVKAYGNYGGGMAVVAAKDEDEAIELASRIVDHSWHTAYGLPQEVIILPCVYNGIPMALDHFETGE